MIQKICKYYERETEIIPSDNVGFSEKRYLINYARKLF